MDSNVLILLHYSDLISAQHGPLSALHEGPGLDLREMEIKWDLDVNQAMLSC